MANITTILGTDSLSSSRISINDNFSSINDQINDLSELLNSEDEILTLSGNINAGGLTIPNALIVNNSSISLKVDAVIEESLILEGGLRKSFSDGTIDTMPNANEFSLSTYLLDTNAISIGGNGLAIPTGALGQEVTFIADGGNILIDTNNIAGVTSLTINQNGTLTLRFYGGVWYIISSFNCNTTV